MTVLICLEYEFKPRYSVVYSPRELCHYTKDNNKQVIMSSLQSALALVLSFLFLSVVQAANLPASNNPYLVSSDFVQETHIGLELDLLQDESGKLSIHDVIKAAEMGQFVRSEHRQQSFGTTSSVLWAHLTLVNNSDQSQELILFQGYPHIDSMRLWESPNAHLRSRDAGDMLPFSQREIATNSLSFILNLKPNSQHTLMLRYQTSGSMSIDLSLYTPIAFAEAMSVKQMIQGIFYGALFALALYNLFIFFIVRDVSYFLYVLYIVTFGIFIACFSGYTAQYIWPEIPWLANISLLLFWGGVIAMALIFSKHFLSLKNNFPRINLISNIFIAIALTCSIAAFFFPYAAVINVLFLIAPVSYSLILFAGIKSVKQGSNPARYFLLSWATLLLASIVATLISAGVISEYASLSPYIVEMGAFVEMVLLSIALASRIRGLEQDSMTDGLTGLFNRRFFDLQLLRTFVLSNREKSSLALLVIDVDHFKMFNDAHGHDQGDIVLQQVSLMLSQAARKSDYVCRFGGEEFTIILPNTELDIANKIAERIRVKIESNEINGKTVTVSIGVSVYNGKENLDVKHLFKRADDALYRAKNGGRNKVETFEAVKL